MINIEKYKETALHHVLRSYLQHIIAIVFLLIYAGFPTKMNYKDGLYFAYHLEEFPISQSWNPHHLLWLPLMHLLYHAMHSIIPDLNAMPFLQALNAVLGTLTVFLMIQITTRICGRKIAGMVSGIFLGLTWGMLYYSADANIYVLTLFLMLWNFWLIIKDDELSFKSALQATFLMILMTSLHQIGFFFSFVIIAAILHRTAGKIKIKTIATCVALYSIATFIINYGIYIMSKPLLQGEPELSENFLQLFLSYGSRKENWTMLSQGYVQAQEIFVRSQFNLFFHIKSLILTYLGEGYQESYNVIVIYILLHLIISVSVLWELKKIITQKDVKWRNSKILLLVWFFPYFIFNQLYCAFEIHFKLFYLVPLLIIWTLQILEASDRERKIWNGLLVFILIGIGGWNFLTGVIQDSKPESNPFLKEALEINPYVTEGDLIIFARHEKYMASITRYYTDADAVFFQTSMRNISLEPISFSATNTETLDFLITRYKRIILSDEAWKSGYPEWYFASHLIPPPHPPILALKKSDLLQKGHEKDGSFKVVSISDIMKNSDEKQDP